MIASIVALPMMLSGCSSPVAGNLDEAQAGRIVVALDHAGIDATKEGADDGKFVVSVSRDDAARALAVLAAEDLPRPTPLGLLDAVGKGDLVPSADAERAAYAEGLSGEFERTLETVDGVLRARVHLNLPEADPLRGAPPQRATASVLIAFRGAQPIAIDAVQRLIAAGTSSLAPSDVIVVMVPRPALSMADRDLSHLGPIAVAHGSLHLLVGVLASLLALVALTTSAMLVFYTRLARLRSARRS